MCHYDHYFSFKRIFLVMYLNLFYIPAPDGLLYLGLDDTSGQDVEE